jgi:hypothetical protein
MRRILEAIGAVSSLSSSNNSVVVDVVLDAPRDPLPRSYCGCGGVDGNNGNDKGYHAELVLPHMSTTYA